MRGSEYCEIRSLKHELKYKIEANLAKTQNTNSKSQTKPNSQNPNAHVSDFGFVFFVLCVLFGFCDFGFGLFILMSTRFNVKHYVRLFEDAVGEAGESREALADAASRFFALMRANNDERLIRSVVRRFEERYCAREDVGTVVAWFASEEEGAAFAPRLQEALVTSHRGGALVEHKSDPALIGGVKMLYDDNYLIEASFRRDVENLFA